MKKAGNIIVSKFRSIVKSGHNKRIAAAATAVVIVAAVVGTSVLSRTTQAAENADTLMGIEKLRNRVSDGGEYTILEIVPDINAAEIGYLFDGYESVLSEWDAETMTWKSWKDVLCAIDNKAERKAFIDAKKAELQAYYDAQGITDNVPVEISDEEYDDSEEYKDGYDEVEAGSYDMNGYFASVNSNTGKFYVSFEYIDGSAIVNQPGNVYYNSTSMPRPITEGLADYIADGAYVYKLNGSLYECVGTWGSIKDSISFPSSSSEETPDNSDDGKDEGNGEESGGNEDEGNENGGDDGNGDGEENGGNGDSGNGDGESGGNGDGGNSGGESGGNGDSGNGGGESSGSGDNGNGGGESGGNGDSGNDGGESGGNGDNGNSGSVNNTGNESGGNSANIKAETINKSAAVGKSFSQIKWNKFVSTTDGAPKTSGGTAEGSNAGNAGSNNNGGAPASDSDKNQNSSSNENTDNSGGNSDNNSGGASNEGTGGNSGEGSGENSGAGTGGDQGDGSDEGTGDGQGSGSGDNSDNGQGNGSGDDSGDGQGSGSGDNSDNGQGNGSGDNSGNGQGSGSGDTSGGNQGGNSGSEDNKDDSNDDSAENPDDNNEDGDAADDTDKDSENDDKGSENNDVTSKDFTSKAQDEQADQYYLVYFDKITDVSLLENGAYVVKDIKPAKFGSYSGEEEHYTGQYDFVEDEGDNTQTYTFPGRVLYCKGVFHNNEWFKHYVINMSKENFSNFKVKVITLTPADLNNIYENGTEEYEKGSIPDFDFLYLNSGLRAFAQNDTPVPPIEEPQPEPDKEGDDSGNGGDTGNNGDSDNGGDTGNNGNSDNGEDTGNPDDSGEGNTSDEGENGQDTGNKTDEENKGQDGGSESGEENNNQDADNESAEENNNADSDNKSDDGNSNAESNNSDEGSGNVESGNKRGEENTGTVNASSWKTYVLNDKTEEASNNSEKTDSNANSDNAGSTDNKISTGDNANTGNSSNTGNNENSGNSSNTGENTNTDDNNNAGNTDTGNTGDNSNTEGGDDSNTGDNNNTNTDNSDGDETDKTENPDNSGEKNPSDSTQTSSDSDKKDNSSSSIALYNTANNDLKKEVADLLFTRISAKALPCLVDGSILYGKADSGAITDKGEEDWANTENTGIFRLAAMLCQETLEKDYTGVSKADLLKGIVKDADKNFTTEQVYCRLGNGSDSIINDNFFKFTIYKEGGEIEEGFQNVLDEINLENLYRKSDSSGSYRALSTNISQAEALRHILNYQNRRNVETKKSIKVLEIQPAYTTEPELTKAQLQKWAPGVEEVETTIMTTAEFIGKIDKLNEIYDLVYIGTSKEHLNIKNWVTDTGKSSDGKYLGSTVFNDKDMEGLIYYNVGDKRVVNLPMSGLLDSEYKNGRTYYYNFARYSGNDITKEKKDALLSFLNGSYPIIVSDEFIEQPVTVFEDEDYSGRRGTLGVGEYTQKDLLNNQIFVGENAPTKGISSIQVKKGYQITLFEGDNFTGAQTTFGSNVNNFASVKERLSGGQTWNNRVRSVIVEKVEDEKVQPVRAIDVNHIDNSSYLYEFANTALEKKYTNFYVKGDIDENGSELFKFYLNRPKAKLADFSANGIMSGQGGGTQVNDVYYIYPNYLGRYTLQYNFTIQNEGAASMDTRYNCKLYIDVNADGKFSDFEEVSDISILNRQSGGGVSTEELYAGIPYTVTREVPGGYKGLLPWKVEICQVNNDNIYASEKGYTKLNGMDKETIRVCQINKNTDNELRVIDLNYEVETEGRYFHTLVYGGDYNGVHYPGISNDFELQIETINIDTFESYFNPGTPDYNPDYLDDFNMLILGFSDAYNDFSGYAEDGNTPLGAVIDFIDSGKSVLMAHDTTSYWNNPIVDGKQLGYTERNSSNTAEAYKPDSRFAANINKYIRPIVGMDRYGVLSSPIVKRGVALNEGTSGWNELFSSGKEIAYKPKSARKETVPEAQGFTYAVINVRDTDEKSKEKRDYTKYNLYSGDYNNRSDFSNTYVSQRFDDCYYDESYKDNGEINSAEKSQNTSGKVKNVHVTQVNSGQITEYPYKLQEEFEVAQTHAQYYQLDYTADDDGDGQSDLVVWYCLGGRTSSSPDKQTTIYSQSPNDVRNNYYIYNKGNITYTGMGHGANDKKKKEDNAAYTFEEAKLFINTIIASYQAGVKPPSITVLESGRSDAAPLTTMYRYYDEENMISLADTADNGQYEKVYFTVRDINFVKGSRVITSHAYYKTDGGSETIRVGGEDISVNPLGDLMYNASDDTFVYADNLSSGGIYYLLVPRTVMSQCEDGLDIYFEAQSTVTTNTNKENVYTTDKVYAKLQVLRAYLFELD